MNYTENGIKAIQSRDYKKAFELLEEGYFDKGETKAGCYLAQMYYDERITPRTEEALLEAMLLWEMTKDEVPSSMHKLGVTLFGSKNNQVKSVGLSHITEASKRDYPVSFCVLGVLAYHKKEYVRAVECFKRYTGIEKDEKALWMYCDALTKLDTPDDVTAIKYLKVYVQKFERAEAYYMLGKLMLKDTNEFVDDALKMLKKAAEMEHEEAIGLLCVTLYYGIENRMERDIASSQPYLLKAIANGYPESLKIAAEVTFYGNTEKKEEDNELALSYAHRALEAGVDCHEILGRIYMNMGRYAESAEHLKVLYDRQDFSIYEQYFIVKYALYKEKHPLFELSIEHGFDLEDGGYAELYSIAGMCDVLGKDDNPYLSYIVGSCQALYLDGDDTKKKGVQRLLNNCTNIPAAVFIVASVGAQLEILSEERLMELGQTAADMGCIDAMRVMGGIYRNMGMYTKSVDLYMKLYSLGYKETANIISDMYLKGQVTGKKDKKKAKEWADKANG